MYKVSIILHGSERKFGRKISNFNTIPQIKALKTSKIENFGTFIRPDRTYSIYLCYICDVFIATLRISDTLNISTKG